MSKKLIKGAQLPQNSWSDRGVREIKVTANSECPMIKLTVGRRGNHFSWIVDSGARESVIDYTSFKDKFPGVELQPLKPGVKFSQADGSPLDILGYFSTKFWFGQEPIPILADIHVCKGVTKTRLLGANILSKFPQWGVDNMNQSFKLGNFQIPLVKSIGKAMATCEVQLSHDVIIPPRCSRFVQASLPHRYDREEFIFRPSERMFAKHKLLLPICLVTNDIFDSGIVIKVSNPHAEKITIHKGTKVGKISNNLKDYEVISGDREDIKINTIQRGVSTHDMQKELKETHEELFKLYLESCELLDEGDKRRLLEILFKFRHVFSKNDSDIGTTTVVKHKIVPRSEKIVYRRQYRHTEAQHQEIDKEVQKLLDCGVIKESMSPYNSPVLMVPKKEEGKWRFCLDCRYINDLTEDQYFPIPRVDEVLDSLSGMEVFTVVDMTAGYHQVELEGKTSEMCAFSTRKGHFQYAKLPMGLRGSGMTFQKMVTLLFSGMLHTEILAYLDDCILFSKTISKHMDILEEVLKRFGEANLKLKPRKCQLLKEQINYLGFLIDKTGIRPDPDRTRIIREIEIPKNVVEVQRFLGKANYYRKFVPHLAQIAHPLYELTKSKGKEQFLWQAEHQSAFDQIKTILTSGQVMGHPKSNREYVLDVDASDYALGAELSQVDDQGELRPIYYASRHLETSERNYSATARETLAAVFGCEYFRQYLQGVRFKLRTDHNPLVWLRSMKEPKRPYSGWIVRLEQFNYEMLYRPGKDHINADYNSRIGIPVESKSKYVSVGIQVGPNTLERPDPSETNHINQQKVDATCSPCAPSECYAAPGDKERMDESLIKVLSHTARNEPVLRGCYPTHEAQVKREENQCMLSECDPTPGSKEIHPPKNIQQVNEDRTEETVEILRKQQLSDRDIGPVMEKLQETDKGVITLSKAGEQLWRVRENLEIKDGLLVRWHKFKAGLKAVEQVVLPTCLRSLVLESLHDSDFAGHFGEQRTLARVKLRYYWPGYVEDVKNWCRTCDVCQRRKGPKSRNVVPLTPIDTGKGPFEHIALDLLKLPVTERGNQYLLVIEDFFSKWVEAFPLQRTNAPSVAQCVLNGWIARFGCPHTILSDQGREFESKLFKSLNEALQTKKLRTTTYHPKTDGMVERSNRTIIDILSKYCEGEVDWDLRLPLILFAIRTSEHSSTGFSPFSLVYGREARIPWDIVYGPAPNTLMPLEKWVADRKKQMSQVFEMVREHTKKRQMQQKRYFDSNLKGEFQNFQMGDLVMMFDCSARTVHGKLNSPWVGPLTIVEKVSDCLYKVRMLNQKEVIVNVEKLKKYYQREQEAQIHNQPHVEQQEDTESESEEDARDEEVQAEAPQEVQVGEPQQEENQGNEQYQLENAPQEPLMGRRGELWCNINPRNIIGGGRRD